MSWFSKVIGSVSPLAPAVVRERYNDLFVKDETVELGVLARAGCHRLDESASSRPVIDTAQVHIR